MTERLEFADVPRRELARALVDGFRAHKGESALFLITVGLQSFFLGALVYLIRAGLDPEWQSAHPQIKLWLIATTMGVVWLARSYTSYLTNVGLEKLRRSIEMDARIAVTSHMMSLSLSFFERHGGGELLQIVNADSVALRDLVGGLLQTLVGTAQAGFLVGAGVLVSPILTLWGALIAAGVAFPTIVMGRTLKTLARSRRIEGVKLYDLLVELVQGARTIKAYRAEEVQKSYHHRVTEQILDYLVRAAKVQAKLNVTVEAALGAALVALILAGGVLVRRGTITYGELLAFGMMMASLQGPLRNIVTNVGLCIDRGPSASALLGFLKLVPEVRDEPDARPILEAPNEIRLQRVSVTKNGTPILRNVSLTLRRGQTIGIVGPSGAGKTTLVNLVARFFDPDEGQVLYDGIDVRNLKLSDLMDQLAIVSQDPFLFNASIGENIRMGRRDATETEVVQAAEAANIRPDVEQLPNKFETLVGYGGIQVSGGQRQRINIARALLKRGGVLILDEATNALDSITERGVLDAFARGSSERITLVVAHRLSTIMSSDVIVVMQEGIVIDSGPHVELIGRCALYRDSWIRQQQEEDLPPLSTLEVKL